ncbi:transcriptional repressor [Rhizina undulata]
MDDHHWEITTSTGRRVSILSNEKLEIPYAPSSYASSTVSSASSPTPPMSPDFCRPYGQGRNNSVGSASSSTSSLNSYYCPRTPPAYSLPLPPLDHLLPVEDVGFSIYDIETSPTMQKSLPADYCVYPSFKYPSKPLPIDRALLQNDMLPVAPTVMPSREPDPPSPKSTAANPGVKRTSRRYTCQCGKSFTTSGHLARHTRIHTGEKNYICPESGCGARFSRQDNCMQHYRTHQSGSASKRAARRRRMSAESVGVPGGQPDPSISDPAMHRQRTHSYHAPQPLPYSHFPERYSADGGLTALANVAISGYP